MQYGITFSHRQAQYLGLDPKQAFQECLNLGFSYIRLCVYWNEVEQQQGTYDFTVIEELLHHCEKYGQKVVLVLGMKAPRWPEFYIPSWAAQDPHSPATQTAVLTFLQHAASHLATFSCISHWQVENEPLDPSGEHEWTVPTSLLDREVDLVRQHDARPVLLTAWGNTLSKRQLLPVLAENADVVGIDVYYQQYADTWRGERYIGPDDNTTRMTALLDEVKKEVWITELQAEPWEKDEAGYLASTPKSCSPDLLRQFVQRASKLPVSTILFWGVEYWLWKAQQGNSCYLEAWAEFKELRANLLDAK